MQVLKGKNEALENGGKKYWLVVEKVSGTLVQTCKVKCGKGVVYITAVPCRYVQLR